MRISEEIENKPNKHSSIDWLTEWIAPDESMEIYHIKSDFRNEQKNYSLHLFDILTH